MQKTWIAVSIFLLPLSVHAATIFSADFESGTVGSPPTGIFTTINAPTGTTVQVASTYNATKGNTLFVEDDVTGTNPSIAQSLGATYGHYIYSFDYKLEAGSSYIHRTELSLGGTKRLDIRFDGGVVKLVDNINTATSLATSAAFTTLAGWNVNGWNTFSYEVNDSTDTIIARVNGTLAFTYTSAGISLDTNQFQIHVGYSSTTDQSASLDNISFVTIPEPSTGLISLLTLGLAAHRKRR